MSRVDSSARLPALALVLLLSACTAHTVVEQRADMSCGNAARVLAKQHPGKKESWPYAVMKRCPGGGATLAALWSPPPADSAELDALVAASLGLADQRLLDSAVTAFQNTTLPQRTRQLLVDVILGQYRPGLCAPRAMWSEPERWSLAIRFDVVQYIGELPIGDTDRDRIRSLFAATATSDSDPLMRRVGAKITAALPHR